MRADKIRGRKPTTNAEECRRLRILRVKSTQMQKTLFHKGVKTMQFITTKY